MAQTGNTQKSELNVCFGAMTFGDKGREQARVHTIKDCEDILDAFQSHGHKEIDTARFYGFGTSEKLLGELGWQKRGLVMETKFFSTAGKNMPPAEGAPAEGWRHTPGHIRQNLDMSLKALQADQVDVFYLHAPDRTTDYAITLKAIDELYKEGKFKTFAISNYMSWEVAQICELCKQNGWVMPKIYQGIYNALHRLVEPELLPCLRHYGLAFYAYNPLGGGWLTGRYKRDQMEHEEGSRFDPNRAMGRAYRNRYWKEEYFDAMDIISAAGKKLGLTEAECACRWMNHHSQMKRKYGDTIIISASSVEHIKSNCVDLDKGPLPDEMVQAMDEAWGKVKGVAANYFM